MSTSSRHSDPGIVLPSVDGAPPRVIRDCKWRIRTFVERDAYVRYDYGGTRESVLPDVVSEQHVHAMNSAMNARSSRKAWSQLIGTPLPELTRIPSGVDLIDSPGPVIDSAWQELAGLVARITAVSGIGLTAASQVLHLMRPRLVAILSPHIQQRLGVPPADRPLAGNDPAAQFLAVQNQLRDLGRRNALSTQLLYEYAAQLKPFSPKDGPFAGQRVPVRLSKVRILDIVVWTDVAVEADNHPHWPAWFAAEVPSRA
jgi:hypothetical protein